MSDFTVEFMHPTNNYIVTATLEGKMTVEEVISELVDAQFITPNAQGYNLARKGGAQLTLNQTFEELTIVNGDIFRIIASTDAG